MMPGAAGRGAFWQPLMDELEPLGTYDCETVDWPGVGGNAPDPDVTSYADLSALLERRVEHGTNPAVLIAQSAGGAVAIDVALRRPELVSHLVLTATSLGIDVEALGASDWRPTPTAAPDPHRPAWVHERLPDRSAELHGLAQPTLLVWADRDAISPLPVGRHLAHLIPGSDLLHFDSDDHWVVTAEAVTVARRIHDLVSGDDATQR